MQRALGRWVEWGDGVEAAWLRACVLWGYDHFFSKVFFFCVSDLSECALGGL